MTCVMEVLDQTGHLNFTWDPDDPSDVARAKGEFDQLKAQGFAFFAANGASVTKIKRWDRGGTLDVRLVREFQPRAPRTVAVRPMRGG